MAFSLISTSCLRLAEFGALADFIVREVSPVSTGEAQRLMLRLFRGVCTVSCKSSSLPVRM
jgi:hypothetical protein